jgi:hypothetical protein
MPPMFWSFSIGAESCLFPDARCTIAAIVSMHSVRPIRMRINCSRSLGTMIITPVAIANGGRSTVTRPTIKVPM